jgi:hypothetical protein
MVCRHNPRIYPAAIRLLYKHGIGRSLKRKRTGQYFASLRNNQPGRHERIHGFSVDNLLAANDSQPNDRSLYLFHSLPSDGPGILREAKTTRPGTQHEQHRRYRWHSTEKQHSGIPE